MLGLNQPTTPKSNRLEYFRLNSSRRPSKNRSTQPLIWRKEKSHRLWQILFLAIAGLLFLMVSSSHASPPRSRGARPIALGNGYTYNSGDVYSLFYNPGGLHAINQKQYSVDYGRSFSEGEHARTDFNGMYAMPFKFKEHYMPLAYGVYGEQAVPGAHILDFTMGSAVVAPVERWSRGFYKLPTTLGLALTIRQQNGEDRSPRVGGSSLGLGLTTGFHSRIDRKHNVGFAIRHLFAGDADPAGPSVNAGISRKHKDNLDLFLDIEFGEGGVWRFKPGMEWSLYRGVLKPRLGWGYRDNGGIDHLATGIGFELSPTQIDLTYLIPLKTLNDNSGQIRASFSYRFGKPQFTEIYYDQALEEASELDLNVLNLTVKEAELKSSVQELEQKQRLAQEKLDDHRKRIEALKDQDVLGQRDQEIRELKAKIKNLEGQLSKYRTQNKALKRKKATIRTHTVKPGDTLQGLAQQYYGDSNSWKNIYNANVDKIERGLPRVGSKLVIP